MINLIAKLAPKQKQPWKTERELIMPLNRRDLNTWRLHYRRQCKPRCAVANKLVVFYYASFGFLLAFTAFCQLEEQTVLSQEESKVFSSRRALPGSEGAGSEVWSEHLKYTHRGRHRRGVQVLVWLFRD